VLTGTCLSRDQTEKVKYANNNRNSFDLINQTIMLTLSRESEMTICRDLKMLN